MVANDYFRDNLKSFVPSTLDYYTAIRRRESLDITRTDVGTTQADPSSRDASQ